jgi:sterol desaturase/sphingolipid hydroxylase (fatty acid hydroxylase superfamily)
MIVAALHWYAANAGSLVVVAVASMIIVEKIRRWHAGRDCEMASTAHSFASAAAFLGAKTIAGKAVFVALAIWVYDNHRFATLDMSNPLIWLAVFVARDGVYYWVHRLEHRVRLLWASHMIHHSSETIGASTAVRVPWMEALYKPWFSLWLPLIGFNPVFAIAFDVFAATIGVFQHTTDFTRTTIWDRVFVTPATHRVHHGSNPEYIDKNFGQVLVVWDRMFGTYEPEVAPVVYGIGAKKLDTPVKLLIGGFGEIAAQLRADIPVAAKLRFLVSRPGSPCVAGTRQASGSRRARAAAAL